MKKLLLVTAAAAMLVATPRPARAIDPGAAAAI